MIAGCAEHSADVHDVVMVLYTAATVNTVRLNLAYLLQTFLVVKGRNILQFLKGEARSAAIHRAARFLCVSLPPSSKDLQAEVIT